MRLRKGSLLLLAVIAAVLINITIARSDEQNEAEKMTVTAGKKVSLEYSLALENGKIVTTNKGKEPLVYVQGGGNIFPALEKGLEGMSVGEAKTIILSPNEAYGQKVGSAKILIAKDSIPPESQQVGAVVEGENEAGQTFRGTIISIDGDNAMVDLNPPLAGKTLIYEMKVLDIQDN